MFKTTNQIREALAKKYGEEIVKMTEDDGAEVVFLLASQEHHQLVQYIFVCEEDGSVTANSSAIANIPEEKVDAALTIINDVNAFLGLGYTMLYMHPDRDVRTVACISKAHNPDTLGEIAVETLEEMSQTVDEVYPQLMQCIWGEAKEEFE